VTHVGKDGKNSQQNYSFRGIDGVLNAVGPALRRHGVIVLPETLAETHETVEVGAKRTPMKSVTVQVKYTFVGPEGDQLVATVPGEAMDSGDKATSKAMSVALRTCLIQTLALPTHEPDPDETTYERSTHPAAGKPALKVVDKPAEPEAAVFDPLDMDTWGETLPVAHAKQALVANFGGDKTQAAAVWGQHMAGQKGPVNVEFLIEIMEMYSGD
jgi:hypothetical protein